MQIEQRLFNYFKVKGKHETQVMLSIFAYERLRRVRLRSMCPSTSLVLRGEGLEVPGILQGLHLVVDSPTEQADEVQAVQLEL